MNTTTTGKIQPKPTLSRSAKKDLSAWEALAGIWKDKKVVNVLAWQKSIRKEWERALPKLK